MAKVTKNDNLRSMTGFASCEGATGEWTWSGEIRSVNGKGLDLRLRMPDWIDGLEAAVRARLGRTVKRGNVSLSLRVSRGDAGVPLSLNRPNLAAVLSALSEIESEASQAGMPLAPTTSTDIAQIRGILEQADDAGKDTTELRDAILITIEGLVTSFEEMRQTEGRSLNEILSNQLVEVSSLTKDAADQAAARKDQTAETLRTNLQKVMDGVGGIDEDRVAQELALLAVKSDVTEEIDRLHAHVNAAYELIEVGGAVGRKMDFLMQEFNREANTLCSKSQNTELTRTGLALKAVIDQMREQVQNVE